MTSPIYSDTVGRPTLSLETKSSCSRYSVVDSGSSVFSYLVNLVNKISQSASGVFSQIKSALVGQREPKAPYFMYEVTDDCDAYEYYHFTNRRVSHEVTCDLDAYDDNFASIGAPE